MTSPIKIIEKIELEEWCEIIRNYPNSNIALSDHALFRLSERQRKVFKVRELINLLLQDKPLLVGLQNNKRYAVFFDKKKFIIRTILEITKEKIEIKTFYNIKPEQIPSI